MDEKPNIIMKIIAGRPAGITQIIEKIPHKMMVLLFTFLRCFVNPACFERSEQLTRSKIENLPKLEQEMRAQANADGSSKPDNNKNFIMKIIINASTP